MNRPFHKTFVINHHTFWTHVEFKKTMNPTMEATNLKMPALIFGIARCGFLSTGLATIVTISNALACQVPVFRYALERWEPDAFQIVVVGPGLITSEQEKVISFLQKAPFDKASPANIRLSTSDEGSTALNADDAPLPRLEVFYPNALREQLTKPIWSGAITMENARRILHSPVRTEITRRILSGESAIWLLVESGDKEKDELAAANLAAFAEQATGALRIPDGVIGANAVANPEALPPSEAENVLMSEVPLKIDFSLVRLSRDNPEEEVFLNMLLNVEDDLNDYRDEPIAYVVFGRGRILQPLIGAGINAENVMIDSTYLCDACSCQVKKENPGIDILMSAPWDRALRDSRFVLDKFLPPLEGTAILAHSAGSTADAADTAAGAEKPTMKETFKINPLLAVGAVVGILFGSVALMTLKMKNKAQ